MSLDSLNRKVGLKLDKSGGEISGDLAVSGGFTVGGFSLSDLIPIGSIMAYAGSSDTGAFLLCDGRAVSRTEYASLFSIIGVTHGSGNGSTTFNIPDYRGRFLRGVDGSAGRDPDKASRTAMASGGATGNSVGSVQTDAFNDHTHTFNKSVEGYAGGGGQQRHIYEPTGGISPVSQATSGAVSGSSSETRPKNAYVNYIIRCR